MRTQCSDLAKKIRINQEQSEVQIILYEVKNSSGCVNVLKSIQLFRNRIITTEFQKKVETMRTV